MPSVSKTLSKKAQASRNAGPAKPAQSKPMAGESDSEDDQDFDDEDSSHEDDDEDDAELSGSDEEDDVTEEGMKRMMDLLGEVDPEELGIEVEGEEEEGDDDEEEEEEDEEEQLLEELSEEDNDVVPVERTTVNDKVSPQPSLRTLAQLSHGPPLWFVFTPAKDC